MAARASRIENQDAIDSAIVGMLADPKEVIIFFMLIFGFWISFSVYGFIISI